MKIAPLNESQKLTFEAFESGAELLFLYGSAGTGKTFLALYLSLTEALEKNTKRKVVIVRSAVPSRDMGFMPGTEREKARLYETPYSAICTELFDRQDAYETLKKSGKIEFVTTSYLRGLTVRDSVVLVDETQNMSFSELSTIMTRLGENSRIIFCGDGAQTDWMPSGQCSGLNRFKKIIERMKETKLVSFTSKDIVRSGIVRSYIEAENQNNLENDSKI